MCDPAYGFTGVLRRDPRTFRPGSVVMIDPRWATLTQTVLHHADVRVAFVPDRASAARFARPV